MEIDVLICVHSFHYLKYLFYPAPTLNKHLLKHFLSHLTNSKTFTLKSAEKQVLCDKDFKILRLLEQMNLLQPPATEDGGWRAGVACISRNILSDVIHIVEICFKYLNNEYKSCIVSRYRVMYSIAGALCYYDLMIYVLDSLITDK